MARVSVFDSPLLLGFDHFERILDRVAKTSHDGYPPYNIEQTGENALRITLAVAGFSMENLTVTIEDNQLIIRGRGMKTMRGGSICIGGSHPGNSSGASCWPKASRSRAPLSTMGCSISTWNANCRKRRRAPCRSTPEARKKPSASAGPSRWTQRSDATPARHSCCPFAFPFRNPRRAGPSRRREGDGHAR